MRCLLSILLIATAATGAVRAEAVTVENPKLSLAFELGERGIALTKIRNKTTGAEHLSRASGIFEFSSRGVILTSDNGLEGLRVLVRQ